MKFEDTIKDLLGEDWFNPENISKTPSQFQKGDLVEVNGDTCIITDIDGRKISVREVTDYGSVVDVNEIKKIENESPVTPETTKTPETTVPPEATV